MTVKDIMTSKVVTANLSTSIIEVADLLYKNHFNCIPVVNENQQVIGVVRRRELFSEDQKLHYPTYISLVHEIGFAGHENKSLPYVAGQIMKMTVKDILNKKTIFATPDMDLEDLHALFLNQGSYSIPVVGGINKLLGIVSESDMLKNMPVRKLSNALPRVIKTETNRNIDNQFKYTYHDMSSRFNYVSKMRVRTWLASAIILFALGFILGIIYLGSVPGGK